MQNKLISAISVIRQDLAGDTWGGLAAMLVALPSAIMFGVIIFSPLGGVLAAQGALAGILGATVLGLVAPTFGGCPRLITAPCAPAAALLSALAIRGHTGTVCVADAGADRAAGWTCSDSIWSDWYRTADQVYSLPGS